MQQIAIFAKNEDKNIVQIATVEADTFSVGRAMWNTEQPNQHDTTMRWEHDADRHLVVSEFGTLLIDSAYYTVIAASFIEDPICSIMLERVEPREMPVSEPLFPLGALVGTPAALAAIAEAGSSPAAFLDRHVRGDWGDVCHEDAKLNRASVKNGTRILSAYQTSKGVKLWVITEADRHSTTILLPSEY